MKRRLIRQRGDDEAVPRVVAELSNANVWFRRLACLSFWQAVLSPTKPVARNK